MIALHDKGSMIVPVAFELFGPLPEQITVGGTPLVRKVELHVTVFNHGIGKLLRRAIDEQPRLETAINQEAARFSWKIKPRDAYYHLLNETPGKPALQTVVVMVDAQVSGFYHLTRELVGADAADSPDLLELKEALGRPPPPHVTLYTSDPNGVQGIALNSVAELDAAVALAGTPAGPPGLRAYKLPSDAIHDVRRT
jgi:hypothetical protein